MKTSTLACAGFLASAAILAGATTPGPDKYSLKVPGGLAFSEFEGYEKSRDYVFTNYGKR